jgi:ribosomal protein S18 acetylase RimI-like enzyme
MKLIDRKALKIRRLVSTDITPTLGIWWAEIPNKEMVASQLRGPLDLSFIAEYEGLLVGFILAKQVYAGMPMTRAGVIFLIAVNPDYQERGIGSILIDTLKDHCKSQGIETIRALIPQNDTKIKKYFEKAGFRVSNIVNYDKPSTD